MSKICISNHKGKGAQLYNSNESCFVKQAPQIDQRTRFKPQDSTHLIRAIPTSLSSRVNGNMASSTTTTVVCALFVALCYFSTPRLASANTTTTSSCNTTVNVSGACKSIAGMYATLDVIYSNGVIVYGGRRTYR